MSPLRVLGLCALSVILLSAPARANGVATMERVGAAMASPGEEMSVTMQLVRPGGATETRTFRMWTKALDGKPAKALIRFDSPASIANTALLTVTRPGGGQDNWLYVPALGQTRRVAAQDRSESFVQSDFTIEDLTVSMDVETRVYTVLGGVDCAGRPCTQVEDRPLNAAAAKQSGYGRVVLYVDDEHAVVHRVDFYDKSDGLLKVLQADGLVQVGAHWRFDRAVVTNVQTGSRTVMTVTARNQGAKVDDAMFSASALDAF